MHGLSRGHSGTEFTGQHRRHKRQGFDPWVGKIPWSSRWQPTPVFLPRKFYKQRSLVGYSQWVTKSLTQLHDWTCTHGTYILWPGIFFSLKMEMTTHSTILAWKLTWTEKPGRLQFMGLQRIEHVSVTDHVYNFTSTVFKCDDFEFSFMGKPHSSVCDPMQSKCKLITYIHIADFFFGFLQSIDCFHFLLLSISVTSRFFSRSQALFKLNKY